MRNAVIAIAGLFGLLLPACGGDRHENPSPAPGAEPKGTDRISIFRNAYDPAADLPRIEPERAVIYMPAGDWSYSHHPSVAYFQGAFYAVYSNGMRGEDEPGQRVMIASSRDFIRWSAPQLLAEPSDGDYGTKKILTPGGIRVCDGRLTVYYTENDNDGTSNARLNPQLYAVTSPDGRTWTRPVSLGLAIFPSHAPLRLSTGRLAMTCNRAFSYSDDPAGLRGWHKCGTAAYRTRFPAMVAEWRARWGAEFPFFYVQLAPYGYTNMGWSPDQTQAARFREVQQQCMSDIPRSGMVATTDIGAVHTIHPPDKKTVAKRLLYLAYARCYGYKGFECSGPVYKSMEIQGENIALSFDHAPYGVSSYGEPLAGFEIAGEDRIFHPAEAWLKGRSTVIVHSDEVKTPVAVRYCYKNYAYGNLYNNYGIAAPPFRTDDWNE